MLIRDDGDGANNNPTPGVDIDAIEYTPVCEAPAADFSADPTSGPAPLTVTFTNQVQATAGCLSGLSWDFGDGATSTQPNPQHKYTQPGAYTVMLTATGPGGQDVRTRQDYIEVTNAVNDDDVSDDDATDDDATDDDHAGDDAAGDDSSGGGSGGCGC